MLSQVHRELERMNQAREKAIKVSREIVPLCAQAIRNIQKEKYGLAEKSLTKIRKKIKAVERLLKKYPDLLYNILGSGYQEYAELSIFLSYIKKRRLPKVDVPPKFYLLGLGDAIGELKREGMNLLSKGKLREAERLKEELEDLYYEFSRKAYPSSLVPGLKPKQDAMRRVLNDYNDAIHSHKMTR